MKKHLLIILIFLSGFYSFAQINPDNVNVINYDISINDIDFSTDSITAETKISLSVFNTADQIDLHLLHLNPYSVINNNQNLSFNYNDTILSISLASQIDSADTISLTVFYNGSPVKDPSGWGGFYFSNNYAYNLGVGFDDVPHNYGRVWFPCVDNFTDRATYNFHIRTDSNKIAVCNGINTSIDSLPGGDLLHHWEMTDEIPTYLASFAVGNYDKYEYTYQGISRNIPVSIYVYPGQVSSAANTFQNLDTILSSFEHAFGPYPWQRVGYVTVPFNSGAMEHATNIAIPAAIIGGTNYETLITHELSHHWFGDYITCRDAQDMWINEGWATYSETFYKEMVKSELLAKNYRRVSHKNVLTGAHIDDNGFHALNNVPLDVTYGTTSYEKGASVVHALRHYMGDSLFFASTTQLLQAKAFDDISSEEMRDSLSNYSGLNLSGFFESRVFTKGFPHYKIDSSNIFFNGASYDVEVFVRQQSYGRTGIYDNNKVFISFLDDDYDAVEKSFVFDNENGSATFNLDFFPELILLDYNEKLSDARITEKRIIDGTGYNNFYNTFFTGIATDVPDTSFFRITHNWVAPDPLKTPVQGLILSDTRYWKIEEDFPPGFVMKGEFDFYNSSSAYHPNDSALIDGHLDSVRLLYRENTADDWELAQGQTLSTITKHISVNTIMQGEYCLARLDNYVKAKSYKSKSFAMYPNPSDGTVKFEFDKDFKGELMITDVQGRIIKERNIQQEKKIKLTIPSGTYYAVMIDKFGFRETKKLIIR